MRKKYKKRTAINKMGPGIDLTFCPVCEKIWQYEKEHGKMKRDSPEFYRYLSSYGLPRMICPICKQGKK